MKQLALGLLMHTVVPAPVGIGLLAYAGWRVGRRVVKEFVG